MDLNNIKNIGKDVRNLQQAMANIEAVINNLQAPLYRLVKEAAVVYVANNAAMARGNYEDIIIKNFNALEKEVAIEIEYFSNNYIFAIPTEGLIDKELVKKKARAIEGLSEEEVNALIESKKTDLLHTLWDAREEIERLELLKLNRRRNEQ